MRRRGPRHWLDLCQASASPSASTLKALQNARRTLHSTALQRNTSGLGAVVQLPRGMAPFQRSRTAVPPLQQRKVTESHSDGGNHAYNGLSSSTTSKSVSSACAQVADQLPPWPVDAFEFNAVVAHGGHNIRLASCTTLLSSNSDTDGVSGEGGATAPLAVATALPNGASPQHVSTAGSVPKLSLVTLNTIQQLKTVEETAEAQAALRGGGWVCTECWSIVHAGGIDNTGSATHSLNGLAPFPRTICPACRTLRHDAHTWSYIASWRLRSDLWQCTCCGERNVRATVNCRCCGAACSGGPGTGTDRNAERGSSVRMTVAVEVESCPIGHVVVTRNRTTRWRCGACKEINSLQMAVCRNCARERFAITVGCPTCDALRVLSNALVFGGEAEKDAARWPGRHMALGLFPSSSSGTTGSAHITTPSASLAAPSAFPARVFGPENCYTPNSTQITCLQCCSPLHGGPVVAVSAAAAWWCACGVVNTAAAYSCLRCRLPRFLECPEKLRALLLSAGKGGSAPLPADGTGAAPLSAATRPTWDFRSCTNWMCDSCCGVNNASYQVVAESTSSPPSTDAPPGTARRGRRLWMHHGDALCRHCGAPWHHHVLPEANSWRCACHMLNPCTNTLCASCGLPALDGIRSDMLSSWSKGDWRCPSCGSLCYRDRQMCSCGTLRSKATARQ
ncbi:hypothetical protein JKF63_05070 [Porcisia hertigi]|uniref:RanBP2-type domain-containing protein n=1 Tax=Porcisia hertigi TaxID=2761500 RepID=A0A836IA88_9TRYP|nr:hypothetical protein JKF63_05070 [Porcisia hertigi]